MTREEAERYIKSKMCNNCGVYLGGGKCSDNCNVIEAIQALSQEPCENTRNMDEIAEIMKSDVDADTKCKMIDNIINSEPHYFKLQQPCIDAVSREAVLNLCTNDKYNMSYEYEDDKGIHRGYDEYRLINYYKLKQLPSVTTRQTGEWIEEKINDYSRKVYCSLCGESAIMEYVSTGDIYSASGHGEIKKTKFCPNCGAKMVEQQESEEE